MSLMKQLLKGTRVKGPKTPKFTMGQLLGFQDLGISTKKRRGGTKLGSKANFKRMLKNV